MSRRWSGCPSPNGPFPSGRTLTRSKTAISTPSNPAHSPTFTRSAPCNLTIFASPPTSLLFLTPEMQGIAIEGTVDGFVQYLVVDHSFSCPRFASKIRF